MIFFIFSKGQAITQDARQEQSWGRAELLIRPSDGRDWIWWVLWGCLQLSQLWGVLSWILSHRKLDKPEMSEETVFHFSFQD